MGYQSSKATMRSYSFIIASSTAAVARPITTIYHLGTLFPTSSLMPPTPPRWLTLASYINLRGCSRRRRSRIFQRRDPSCFINVCSPIPSSSKTAATTIASSTASSCERRVHCQPPVMLRFTSCCQHKIWSSPQTSPSSLSSLFITPPTKTTIPTRLFGCNPNSPHAAPGNIFLSDDREDDIITDHDDDDEPDSSTKSSTTTIPIDLAALRNTVQVVREIIGYPTYDVSLTLVNDAYMRQLNADSRGISSPTDVLSFSPRDSFVEPGVLKEEPFDIDDYYDLGELFIDVDYVQRRCEEDRALHAAAAAAKEEQEGGEGRETILEGEVVSETGNAVPSEYDRKRDAGEVDDDDANSDEYEYGYMEVEVNDEYYYEDEYDDRGVAPAMQYIYDPEVRIHMLVVHGMLHLVGYDHETDDEYELMVVREDEVLAELKRRLGEDFGLQRRLPSPSCE